MSTPSGWPPPQAGGQVPPPAWQQPPPAGWQAPPMQSIAPPQRVPQDDSDGAEPLEFHVLLRRGRQPAWAWSLLGVLLTFAGVFVLAQIVLVVPFLLYFAATGEDLQSGLESLIDFTDPRPASLAYLNLSLASAIPIVWLVTWGMHGLRPRWTTSIRPRMRWGYFAICLVLSVIALVATVIVGSLLPSAGGTQTSGQLNEWTPRLRDFALVVLLLTPLQAAGEEYLFRGYLTQAVGSIADSVAGRAVSRTLAVVVPALIFAVFHGLSQSVPVFVDRFAFGLVAGVLVIVTGGLEAGIAMHVLNNFVAFGLALAYSDLGSALTPTGGSWWMLPSTLTQSLVYLGLAWGVARLMGLNRTADPAVLAASRGLVYRSTSARPER